MVGTLDYPFGAPYTDSRNPIVVYHGEGVESIDLYEEILPLVYEKTYIPG
jgi:hypothetical protein